MPHGWSPASSPQLPRHLPRSQPWLLSPSATLMQTSDTAPPSVHPAYSRIDAPHLESSAPYCCLRGVHSAKTVVARPARQGHLRAREDLNPEVPSSSTKQILNNTFLFFLLQGHSEVLYGHISRNDGRLYTLNNASKICTFQNGIPKFRMFIYGHISWIMRSQSAPSIFFWGKSHMSDTRVVDDVPSSPRHQFPFNVKKDHVHLCTESDVHNFSVGLYIYISVVDCLIIITKVCYA